MLTQDTMKIMIKTEIRMEKEREAYVAGNREKEKLNLIRREKDEG